MIKDDFAEHQKAILGSLFVVPFHIVVRISCGSVLEIRISIKKRVFNNS